MYKRLISLPNQHSFFLFGQRGTGKSSLLQEHFKQQALFINLLDSKQFLLLSNAPWKLRQLVAARTKEQLWVVIDEIQKIPALLDEVHFLIEDQKINFALTGSSARKLKKAGVNLLAGRAFNYKLFPLTTSELGGDFEISQVLQWGSLPTIFNSSSNENRAEYLYAYVQNYLKEEILYEQIVRQIEPFTRFLEVAAQTNGKIVNFNNIARDVNISSVSIKSYFQVLEDTLVGFMLPSYHPSIRKRQKQAAKFYFYDLGLVRALKNQLEFVPDPQTYDYGCLFESFLINEFVRLNEYSRSRFSFSHLRIDDKTEVDLIIECPNDQTILVEIKSKDSISEKDLKSINKLQPYIKDSRSYCLSMDPVEKRIGETLCLHWKTGLELIFQKPSFLI